MSARLLGEYLGTAFLLLVVAGSGIMGEQLAGGNAAVALLANSLATGAGLYVLIQCLGPISGAHFNPVVSGVEWWRGELDTKALFGYIAVQFTGAVCGVWLAHAIFALPLLQVSRHERYSPYLWLSELVATFGLVCVIRLLAKRKAEVVPSAVALYVLGAYWFTSSTSFANPAVTFARTFTDTFCGIAPAGVLPFMLAQLMGAGLAQAITRKIA